MVNIWQVAIATVALTILLLLYIKYGTKQKDNPLRIIPSGRPVLRIGEPPNIAEYNVEEVVPCVGYGWGQFGEQVAVKLKEPLLRSFAGFGAGTRTLIIDNRLISARTRDGHEVTSFEDKFNSDSVLVVHKDYFERDMDHVQVGEFRRVLSQLEYETNKRIEAQATMASVASPEDILEKAKHIIRKAREVLRDSPQSPYRPAGYPGAFRGAYDSRFITGSPGFGGSGYGEDDFGGGGGL